MTDTLTKKKCSSCNKLKLVSEFNKRKNSSDGYMGYCKECLGSQVRRRRQRHRIAAGKSATTVKATKLTATEVQRAEANRNAMIALVRLHKFEFDSLVTKELIRMKYMQGEDKDGNVWIPTAIL